VTPRAARTLARGSFAICVVLPAATAVFIVLAWSVPVLPNEFGFKGYAIAFSLVTGGVGAVIVSRRPENAIGRILCGLGVLAGVVAFANEYARWALIHEDGRPPGGLYGAWLQEWVWIPMVLGLAVIAWIFPDGTFLSSRWRTAMILALVLAAVPMSLNALLPHLTIFAGFPNPIALHPSWTQTASNVTSVLLLPTIIGGAAAATRRFRRGSSETRQQIKWLLLSVAFIGALILYYVTVLAIGADPNTVGSETFSNWIQYLAICSFLAIPISIGLGVLKYRLYDIDLVINKAVVYGALAVFITVVYVAIVAGVGAAVHSSSDPLLSAIAAAVVALAFQPARRSAQRLANRLVYGERATPYEVLARLGERLAYEYAAEDVLDRIAAVVADGVGAERCLVWLLVGHELRPAAVRPAGSSASTVRIADDLPAEIDGARAFPVRHQGATLGAIGVAKPTSDPLAPGDEKLVSDLADQAGLVLRNVGLIEDLRASRRRLVAAQDEERRRLERNIHDGAQQQLVALTVKARLAGQMLERDPSKARALIEQIQAETTDALEDLRDLARGIYPPLLADKGLVAAVEAQARKVAIPVGVEADGIGRFDRDVEAGIYFCVLEALNNVAKYANATHVDVRFADGDGHLAFEVRDDGGGFDQTSHPTGTGLQGMADRLSALGGTLEVASRPAHGTTVRGRVPVASEP
jgi:signal transduction histidine kinase